jgi:hypothetical protein
MPPGSPDPFEELDEMNFQCSRMPRLGDEGQRYVVSVFDSNMNKRINLAYTDDAEHASRLATTSELRPSWKFAWVTDRHTVPTEAAK